MPYAAVDQTIGGWADANVKKLFLELADREARFCYLSSPQGECYQISIDAPENELVRVHVWAIETIDDMEAHLEWFVPIVHLRATLDVTRDLFRDGDAEESKDPKAIEIALKQIGKAVRLPRAKSRTKRS